MGNKQIILYGMTALRYWRLAAAGLLAMPKRCRVTDITQVTANIRDIPAEHLAWMTIPPVVLAAHGIVPRAAIEPGLKLMAARGAAPSLRELTRGVSTTDKIDLRKAVIRNLVRLSWREMETANAGAVETVSPGDKKAASDGVVAASTGAAAGASRKPSLDYKFPNQLELMVGTVRARRSSSDVAVHCITRDLPPGSLWRVNDSVLIVSPALLLAQLARPANARPHAIAAAGIELAGTYSLLPSGYVDCSKLIDEGREIVRIDGTLLGDGYARARSVLVPSDFADLATPAGKKKPAKRTTNDIAAPLILAGSASPFETAIDVSLALTRWHGGFCAGVPTLNETVALSPEAQALYGGRKKTVLDALFIGKHGIKIDVEPGGDAWHSPKWKQDNRRRQALEHDGYKVVAVSWDEFADFSCWLLIAESISRRLGHTTRDATDRIRERQQRVHADLANPDFLRESFGS